MAQVNLNVTNNLELPKEGMVGIGFDNAKKLTAKDDEGNTWEIGGGGGGLVNITYAELIEKMSGNPGGLIEGNPGGLRNPGGLNSLNPGGLIEGNPGGLNSLNPGGGNPGGLIPGQQYLLTDFKTTYNIFDGGDRSIIEAAIADDYEPLIITAISTNEIDYTVTSVIYPNDKIYYSPTLLNDGDIGFGDGAGAPVANFKGQIYYRKDTIQNVETHYDFRNVKFRRWAVDAELYEDGDGVYATYTGQVSGMTTDVTLTADTIGVIGNTISLLGDGVQIIKALVEKWNESNYPNTVTVTAGDGAQIPDAGTYITLDGGVDGASAYVENDVCKSVVDGKIYKCITATTGEGDPTVNTADWVLWLDITADAFISWTSDKTKFNIGDITTNLIINNVTAGVDYDDFYTFGDYYNWVKNVSIGMIDLEYAIGEYSYATQLNNIVFKTIDNRYTCFGNNIGSNCWNNTIGNVFVYNIIGNDFNSNTIGNYFNSNTIGDYFNSNTIGNHFSSNTIGNVFVYNTIGNDFSSNTIGNDFYSNAIGSWFSLNTIGNYLRGTIFGDSCQYNTIANKINEDKKIITFGNSITMCTIQDYAFRLLAADLDLTAATHIRGTYNTTIYQDAVDGVKLSYMTGGVLTIADVTD